MLGFNGCQRSMYRSNSPPRSTFPSSLRFVFKGITNPSRKQTAPIVVENYPLVARSLEELERIRHMIDRRRIENAEKKLRRQILSENSPGQEPAADTAIVILSIRISFQLNSFLLA